MTIGMDVSALFPDVIMFASSYDKYATIEINRSLTDFSGYVRKTALLDPQVIVNAISTLNEIKPGYLFIFDLVQHLMIKFKEFNEWSQCIVLECLSRYTPSSEDESLDILIQEQVYERIKEPFITLIENSESNETSFTILHHIPLLISRSPRTLCYNSK
ncbi:hypothetical protein ACTFIY_005687 [Dictyostelium cf. discoideum]